ncbi:MAG: hypothetical protein JWQ63_2791 [Mucilaginibacter sp.]|jgi:hypothetical protein|nr:hypothetical protein [Mucilaginibacter sp.]
MKNVIKVALVAAGMLSFSQSHAQTTEKDTGLGHKIGHAAKKVGHKTAELGAKGAAAVVDKRYEGKQGPHGQTIYINEDSRYYYINKRGHRVFLKKSQLRDKPAD